MHGMHVNENHGWPEIVHSDESQNPKSDNMNISLNITDPRNCEKCGFEAEDLYQYDAHTWEVHDEDSLECKFCDEAFENKGDLMSHNKEEHQEISGNMLALFCWILSLWGTKMLVHSQ